MKDTGHAVDPLRDGVQHLVLAGHVLLGGDSNTGRRNTYTKVTNMAIVILAVETHTYTKVTNMAIVILAVESHTQRSQIWQH